VGISASGEEAIEMTQNADYDIIFIDMKLPVLNGLETYLAIRKRKPHAVAIMMTAYRQEMDSLMEQALNNNAYACLHKPLEIDTVLRLVENILAMKEGPDGPA
jgi:CheY-like chemotaxis protein